MMRASVWTAAIAAAIAICGCGDNDESPDPDTLVTDPATVSLEIGQTSTVSAMFKKDGGAFTGGDITWETGNHKLAVVDGDGNAATITAVGSGVTTVTATSGERPYTGGTLTAQIVVTVKAAAPTSILISPINPQVPVGKTVPVHVVAHLQDGSFLEVTNDVAWTVNPLTAATATGSQLTGLVAGSATISASYHGLFSSTDIDVTP